MTLAAVPGTWFFAYLSSNYNVPRMLIVTDILCLINLSIMIMYARQAGTWQFATAYFIGESIDSGNFIFTATLLYARMKPESRGAIMSVNSVSGSFGAILLLWMQAEVQGRHGDDFGSGAKEVFEKYWITLFGYWCLVVTYVIFSKDTGPIRRRGETPKATDKSLELQ